MEDQLAFRVTPSGIRMFIAAMEYALGYEHINTSAMSDAQLHKYHQALHRKSDIKTDEAMQARFGEYMAMWLETAEQGNMN